MDLFEKYFKELAAGAAKSEGHERMAMLVAARAMLNYPERRSSALSFLARQLYRMGHLGEAYQAALALPREERGEAAAVVAAIEDAQPRNLTVNIEIITKCNLRCPLCVSRGRAYVPNGNQVMPLEVFKKIWAKVAERASLAVLVGKGESFLHPRIYEILDFVRPTPVHIDTNASCDMDHERIVRSSLQTLLFSVDGVDQRTYGQYRVGGNFAKALENIRAVVAAKKKYGRGPNLIFKYIIFRHNEAYVEEALQLAKSLGVDSFVTSPCNVDPQVDRATARRFLAVGSAALTRIRHIDYGRDSIVPVTDLDTPYCATPFQNPFIQIDGALRPCCNVQAPGFYYEPATETERREAERWRTEMNILNHSLDELWAAPDIRDFRLRALRNAYEEPACQHCLYPANHLGRLFEGTDLAPPRRPEPSGDRLNIADLRVEADYAAELLANGLTKDLEYYRESGALSPEAAALLAGAGQKGGERPGVALQW